MVLGKQDLRVVGPDGISTKHRRVLELIEQGCDIKIIDEAEFLRLSDDPTIPPIKTSPQPSFYIQNDDAFPQSQKREPEAKPAQNQRQDSRKSKAAVEFALCMFLGMFGAHKFYRGKIKEGLLYLCTGGLLAFGWIGGIFSTGAKLLKIGGWKEFFAILAAGLLFLSLFGKPRNNTAKTTPEPSTTSYSATAEE